MKKLLWLVWLCIEGGSGFGQILGDSHRVVFYNVENLFDTRNDSLTLDDDFTPRGKQNWTQERYQRKLIHIAQVLSAIGGNELPTFIGLAEVENRRVLNDLTKKTSLCEGDYEIVHADSPDQRGMDVAFLYRKHSFQLLKVAYLPIPLDSVTFTRDILYCEGILSGKDTLHFFVAHFPSMRGGEQQSEWKRLQAAKILRQRVDSIFFCQPQASILIMGDLNGRANTAALKALEARNTNVRDFVNANIYNTGYYLLRARYGSYYYQGKWMTIDHLIVSGSLLNGSSALQVSPRLQVFRDAFLLEEDKKYFGWKPKRTYLGPRYVGGYSDHLPIYVDLKRE